MHRSVDGPARSLLNSFTVATTPPPRSTAHATSSLEDAPKAGQEDDERERRSSPSPQSAAPLGQEAEDAVWADAGEQETRAAGAEVEEEDEEPRPSFIAPQPAPAPFSSADQSLDTFAATAAPTTRAAAVAAPGTTTGSGQPSTNWQSAWRPAVRYGSSGNGTIAGRALSLSPSTAAAASGNTAAHSSPFTWRTTKAETPVRPSVWRSTFSLRAASADRDLRGRSSAAADAAVTAAIDSSGLTPKIRYRSSSSSVNIGATRAGVTSSPSPPSASHGVQRHSPERLAGNAATNTTPHIALSDFQGRRSASWGTEKVKHSPAVAGNSSILSSGWPPPPQPREHAAPLIAPVSAVPTWTPASILKTADAMNTSSATSRGSANAGLASLRPPPPLTRTRPGAAEVASNRDKAPRVSVTDVYAAQPAPRPLAANALLRDVNASGVRGVEESEAENQLYHEGTAAAATGEDSNVTDTSANVDSLDQAEQRRQALPSDATLPQALGHLTLRSLTEEYNQFTAEGTVGWVGLQVHLRRHTQSTQITALDLTCYRMQREQWSWFTLDILPQLQSLEVLRLVQMGLVDDEVAELVRGSCGWCSHVDGTRTVSASSLSPLSSAARRSSPQPGPATSSTSRSGSASPRVATAHAAHASTAYAAQAASAGAGGAGFHAPRSAPLAFLRVLDLSGNAITQRSCTHLGKMLLWMADSLVEVRLLGNPLKDYGMQTLGIYVSKLNVEALQEDPELFPGTLRHQLRLAQQQQQQGGGGADAEAVHTVEALPIGPCLLDLRDCRASPRGLSDILAAASRAHRLHTVILSHNVAGVTALLPLPATAYREALDVTAVAETAAALDGADSRAGAPATRTYRLEAAPRRLRLAKTPLITSGALLRRQHAAFSDVHGFASSCALSTLVLHGVPLSQTCSPVGCRELLLNVFFSCPRLTLVDLSDTFEWALVPAAEQRRLVAAANRRDAVEQRLRGPAVQRGLQMFREDQGEVEFALESATVGGQTRLGDIFGELMAHAAHNAVVRRRLVPAAFAHVRELDLSHTGLTDAGVRGLCVSVRRGRTRTGMLASLAVLNLADNLLTVRGCLRVISSFLLDDSEGDESPDAASQMGDRGDGENRATQKSATAVPAIEGPPLSIAQLTTLALQRNAGVEGDDEFDERGEADEADDASESAAYVQEVCTAAEAAVLRRATLRSAARSSPDTVDDNAVAAAAAPPLTVYFSAPPLPPSPSSQRHLREQRDGDRFFSDRGRPLSELATRRGDVSVVYYAGCDERGDIFCTCPRSRFFVPRAEADRLLSASAAPQAVQPHTDTLTTPVAASLGLAASHVSQAHAAAANAPAVAKTNNNPISGTGTSASSVLSRPGAQRSLLAALDVPRTQLHGRTSSVSIGGAMLQRSTPDVRLPPRPAASVSPTVTVGMESLNGLVNSAPLYPTINSVGDTLASSMSFPPPPSVASYSAGPLNYALQPPQQQQQQQHLSLAAQQRSRHGSVVSNAGTSLGSLFMEKTSPREANEEEGEGEAKDRKGSPVEENNDEQRKENHNANERDAAAPEEAGQGLAEEREEKDNLNSSTVRSSKRRAKARQSRTFVLSYDHPAGHLLCRAFNVLARPAPDPFGIGARAALATDLLAALQRACTRAAAYPDGGGGDGENEMDDAHESNGPAAAFAAAAAVAVVVESVAYIPPDTSPNAEGGAAESHWMRFEITTNERKARMAQRLQEVLNVSWAAQCVRFAHLLQWLRAHVVAVGPAAEGGEGDGGAAKASATVARTAGGVAEWDPVQVVERAARASADTRTRLDALYAGSAVAAVHAHHTDSLEERDGFDTAGEAGEAVSAVIALAQLHPQLWREVGLAAEATPAHAGPAEERVPAKAPAVNAMDGSAQADGQALNGVSQEANDKDVDEAGEEMYSAISTSEDTSRRSQMPDEDERKGGGKGQGKVPVVDLYGAANSPGATAEQQSHVMGDKQKGADRVGDADKLDEVDALAVSTPSVHSPQQMEDFTSPAASPVMPTGGDAVVISTSLAPGMEEDAAGATQPQPSQLPSQPASTSTVTLRTKIFRNFDELSDSSDDDDDGERGTKSVETPEKQMRGRDRQRKAEAGAAAAAASPSEAPAPQGPPSPHSGGLEEVQEEAGQLVLQSPMRGVGTPRAGEHRGRDVERAGDRDVDEGGAVLTDQLMGPPSPSELPLSRKTTAISVEAEPNRLTGPRQETVYGAADVPAAVTTRSHPQSDQNSAEGRDAEGQPQGLERRSDSNTVESRLKDGTRSDSPSSPGSRQRAQAAREAPASPPSLPTVMEKITADPAEGKENRAEAEKQTDNANSKEGKPAEDGIITSSPVRVQRRPSELEGRVKTFTLSYTHQEGTAVCRAWRLLHTALSGEAGGAETTGSPTSPTSVALAQEARDCLCDDFLALLQPPDEDRKHAVLSVALHGDSGAATAMLQVQVQTNERRGTLANRLQDSNHGVRRSPGVGGRGGIVPLTVDEVDHFYFPRLTRLLRRHAPAADTVSQMERFLAARPAVQARLIKSYGSIGSLVHYYHGSATALEHELGISSWRELTGSVVAPTDAAPPASPSPTVEAPAGAGAEMKLQLEVSSPTIANDRVMPQRGSSGNVDRGGEEGDGESEEDKNDLNNTNSRSNPNQRILSRVRGGRLLNLGKENAAGDDGDEAGPRNPSTPDVKKTGSNNSLNAMKLGAVPAAPPPGQGRPPPHPRRPPTPPNPITHTDSISFDEITEEPTSEAGPVVVLRGSTPSATARSPSTPNSRNPQYYPANYRINAPVEPRSPRFADSPEQDRSPRPRQQQQQQQMQMHHHHRRGSSGGGNNNNNNSNNDLDSDPGALSPMTSASASPSMARLSGASPPPHTQQTLEGGQYINVIKDTANKTNNSSRGAAASATHEGQEGEAKEEHATPSPSPQMPPRNLRDLKSTDAPEPPPRLQVEPPPQSSSPQKHQQHPPQQQPSPHPHDRRGQDPSSMSGTNLSRQVSVSSSAAGGKSEYERVLEGKYKRLMRVAYDGVARGSVPLEPQHQQKTVIGRGKWGTQKVELSLEWEILFVLTFEKSRPLGRSSRRAQMVVHPVGIGFECMSGDEASHQANETSSLHSSMVNAMTAESSGIHHPPGTTASQVSRGSRTKKESAKSAASHLIISIQRPFSPNEVGSSSSEIEKTLMAGALLTVSSATSLSKAARLLGGGADDVSNTSRGSAGTNQAAQDMVYQLCQRSLTLDIEMKSSKHVQEALRLLKNSIRRATQAVKKSMSNAHIQPSPQK